MKRLLSSTGLLLVLSGCSNTVGPVGYSPASPMASMTMPALQSGAITSGNRSGDYKVSRNSIDSILNVGGYSGVGAYPGPEGEQYPSIRENKFTPVSRETKSTFSIDVDTASYSNFRRFVNEGGIPEPDSLRTEEMVNYFDYNYAPPVGDAPFAVTTEIAACPWNSANRLALIALRAQDVAPAQRPPANLVFLIDVSGSMEDENKLPLVRKSFRLLLDELNERDRVAIVTYASSDRVALPPTPCSEKRAILRAIDSLESSGGTNGEGGIQKAYQLARENFQKDAINRVILATDGDFNIGISDPGKLEKLIEKEAKSGVYLTALGFGMYNLRDDTLQSLAQHGNGHHAYIDTLREAEKVLVTDLPATLQTVAKDVKIQVQFNPAAVESYRLIGYETRLLENEDFANDAKDAGEMGSGHKVTALYEIVPAKGASGDTFTLNLRHKAPDSSRSQLQNFAVRDAGKSFGDSSREFRFATAVAAFSQWLNRNPALAGTSRNEILSWAKAGARHDPHGYRKEFLQLARKAKRPELVAAE